VRDLSKEYLNEAADLMPFYACPLSALYARLPGPVSWPKPLVEEMRAYNERIGTRATLDGTELVVVTGQQPGLFTGPLYTIYKAITAIKLAQQIEARSGRRCIPVFWAASEDHDFEEAATAHFLTKRDEPLSLTYKPKQDITDLPLYRVPVEDSVHEAIDTAAQEMRKSELTDSVTAFLHESAEQSRTLCEWFTRLLSRMFRDTPLVLFVPHLPAARALQSELMAVEIQNPLESTRRLNDAGNSLAKLGFQPQVTKSDNMCNFFLEVGGRRRGVTYEDARFHLPEEGITYTGDELLALLAQEPGRFSANVALRPVVQQRLFNAVAYVAGPAELGYWGQIKGVFEQFGQSFPAVYPRAQCALVTTRIRKLMEKLSLSPRDLERPLEQLEQKVFRHIAEEPSYGAITVAQKDVRNRFRELLAILEQTDPVAREMTESMGLRVDSEFDRIRDVLTRRDEERVEAVRRQVVRLQQCLVPWRKPQERVYTVFSFMFEHGWGLAARLLKEIDIGSFQLQEVEL